MAGNRSRKVKRKKKKAFKVSPDVRRASEKAVSKRVLPPNPQSLVEADVRRSLEQAQAPDALPLASIPLTDLPNITPKRKVKKKSKKKSRKVKRKKK